ncbi:MAG: methylated-DNA--[protein]-cysteine S-methyltransferase [Acidimicrobiia bacterium]
MTMTTTTTTEQFTVASPIGPLDVTVVDGRLRRVVFDGSGRVDDGLVDRSGIARQLRAYFGGDLDAIDAIDTELAGTPFQRSVWELLRTIPAGETMSYRDVAAAVGRPTSSRAVGNAVGSNPVPVAVPCHRVITSAGGLGGFGGGLDRKRWLLGHERALPTLL